MFYQLCHKSATQSRWQGSATNPQHKMGTNMGAPSTSSYSTLCSPSNRVTAAVVVAVAIVAAQSNNYVYCVECTLRAKWLLCAERTVYPKASGFSDCERRLKTHTKTKLHTYCLCADDVDAVVDTIHRMPSALCRSWIVERQNVCMCVLCVVFLLVSRACVFSWSPFRPTTTGWLRCWTRGVQMFVYENVHVFGVFVYLMENK